MIYLCFQWFADEEWQGQSGENQFHEFCSQFQQWWKVLVPLSGVGWLQRQSIMILVSDRTSAETKATMTKDGNFFCAFSTNI